MRVSFADLEQSERCTAIIDDGWFPAAELTLVDGPHGQATARLGSDGEAVVNGTLEFSIRAACDRCGADVELRLSADFAYRCTVGGEENGMGRRDTECLEEDVNRCYLKEPVIDLGLLFREQAFLSIPARTLCSESCRGLCQHCGTDLNQGRCDCANGGHDSPFAGLRRLQDR